MGFDTHMIAGSRACSTSARLILPTITSQTSPHYAEALGPLRAERPERSGPNGPNPDRPTA